MCCDDVIVQQTSFRLKLILESKIDIKIVPSHNDEIFVLFKTTIIRLYIHIEIIHQLSDSTLLSFCRVYQYYYLMLIYPSKTLFYCGSS